MRYRLRCWGYDREHGWGRCLAKGPWAKSSEEAQAAAFAEGWEMKRGLGVCPTHVQAEKVCPLEIEELETLLGADAYGEL